MRERQARVQMLGKFRLHTATGATFELDSARAESLLAYLALNADRPHSRQRLAGLLWPDSTEAQARTNLRHLVHTIRRDVGAADALIEITSRTLAWRGAGYRVDAADFDTQLDDAARLPDESRLDALSAAVRAYPDDLLSGHDDPWLIPERDRLRGRFADALEELATLLQDRGHYPEAVTALEQLLRVDPLRESAYRQLMLTHVASGDRARAVRAFHACATLLGTELGVRPSAATHQVYASLLPAESRPASQQRRAEPPLVGRAKERRLLADAWRAAESGHALLVVLTGEPGIGKTRLAEAFAGRVAQGGAVTAVARAHAAEGSLAYAPVVSWLRSPSLRAALDRIGPAHRAELARVLPELRVQPPDLLAADEQRQRLFDAIAATLRSSARPVLLIADDLHRFDRESLRVLHYLIRAGDDLRILVVATARPEDADGDHKLAEILAGLRRLGRVVETELPPLTGDEAAMLAVQMTGVAPTDVARLYTDSEGNPLFLVEALRAGWPRRTELSPKVRAVIEARLAQLSASARDLLGLAATIGREFSTDVLGASSTAPEDAVVSGLDELWLRRIIRDQGSDGYDFTHERIREVAYRAVAPARRRQHHRCIADVLARAGTATPDDLCGQIADHYLRAGSVHAAVAWSLRASDAANRLHAYDEAVHHINRALEHLRALPPAAARNDLELALLSALPGPLCAMQSYSSADVLAVQSRALSLAEQLAVDLDPPVVRSLAITSLARSDFDSARRFGRQAARSRRARSRRRAGRGGLLRTGHRRVLAGRLPRGPRPFRTRRSALPARAPRHPSAALQPGPSGRVPQPPCQHAVVSRRRRRGGPYPRKRAGTRGADRPPLHPHRGVHLRRPARGGHGRRGTAAQVPRRAPDHRVLQGQAEPGSRRIARGIRRRARRARRRGARTLPRPDRRVRARPIRARTAGVPAPDPARRGHRGRRPPARRPKPC